MYAVKKAAKVNENEHHLDVWQTTMLHIHKARK